LHYKSMSSSSSSGSAPAFSTRSAARAGANTEGPAPGVSAEEGVLHALFAEGRLEDIPDWMAVDVMKGSELATSLVTKHWGLVFILVDEGGAVVWQVVEFRDLVVAKRVTEHARRKIALLCCSNCRGDTSYYLYEFRATTLFGLLCVIINNYYLFA
jgi:hypothetical protein